MKLRLGSLLTCISTVGYLLRSCFAVLAVGGFVPYLTTVVALPSELCCCAKLHGHRVITIMLVLPYINQHR